MSLAAGAGDTGSRIQNILIAQVPILIWVTRWSESSLRWHTNITGLHTHSLKGGERRALFSFQSCFTLIWPICAQALFFFLQEMEIEPCFNETETLCCQHIRWTARMHFLILNSDNKNNEGDGLLHFKVFRFFVKYCPLNVFFRAQHAGMGRHFVAAKIFKMPVCFRNLQCV